MKCLMLLILFKQKKLFLTKSDKKLYKRIMKQNQASLQKHLQIVSDLTQTK